MKKIVIPATDIAVSRFILGTASLFSAGTRRKREALLSAALEAGFSHFDTAPYYGFGTAERDLGKVLRAHPHATVTSKFGLYSPGGEMQAAPSIVLRKVLGRVAPVLSQPLVDFSIARTRLSLEQSMQRLGRGRIELYLLHEPLITLIATEEMQRWLEDCVRAGKIGSYGIAATPEKLEPFLRHADFRMPVIQMPDSLHGHEAALLEQYGHPRQITYGYVSAARRLGIALPVSGILQSALQRNPDSAIIVSTRKQSHLHELARTEAMAA